MKMSSASDRAVAVVGGPPGCLIVVGKRDPPEREVSLRESNPDTRSRIEWFGTSDSENRMVSFTQNCPVEITACLVVGSRGWDFSKNRGN